MFRLEWKDVGISQLAVIPQAGLFLPVPLNPIATFDRKIKLCNRIDLAKNVGLEFGPLSRPVVTKVEGDVR